MNIKHLFKYLIRFLLLQTTLTTLTIYYFDRFLMNEYEDGYLIIINNLLDDRDRFYPFIQNNLIKIDIYLAIFIFLFLIGLYSTKFFTYVNELTFSVDKKFFDEYLNIYLLWTSFLMTFLFIFRFSVVSRSYLFLFTFLIPFVIQIYRNTELLSSILGRSINGENYITFNLAKDSVYRNLRIMTFRKKIEDYELDLDKLDSLITAIDKFNKQEKVNLVVINLEDKNCLPEKVENYLLNLNKKVLLISNSQVNFENLFIKNESELDSAYLTYFNNDIQYGSKYILKRFIDITLSSIMLIVFLPVFAAVGIFIIKRDGYPFIVSQNRIGLHGTAFKMYKFRTMYIDSHKKRESLEELNKNDEVIFKIDNDPRIFRGGEILRKYSLDELPQLWNVIRGDMSLVGPRPLFKEDTSKFDESYMRRLNVLPGITGLLQINERNTDEFKVWYKYDIEYIDNWNILLDIKILLKTPKSILINKTKGL
ncbi:sugar transferase [Candidatus Actinomarina sp.]|nr:sugar transferase [Candidatus Actinomarina sp.]